MTDDLCVVNLCCMVVWTYDHIHYLFLPTLVSRPDSLPATNKASVFLFAAVTDWGTKW